MEALRRRSSRLAAGRLNVSTEEMKELMEYRGIEAVKALHELYGGAERLCHLLGSSPTEGSFQSRHGRGVGRGTPIVSSRA